MKQVLVVRARQKIRHGRGGRARRAHAWPFLLAASLCLSGVCAIAPFGHAAQSPTHGTIELRAPGAGGLQTSPTSRASVDPLAEIARQLQRVRNSMPGPAGERDRRTVFQSLVRMPELEAQQALRDLLERCVEGPASEPARPLEFPRGVLGSATALQILEVVAEQAEVELPDHRLQQPDRAVYVLVDRFLGYLSPAALVLGARLDNGPEPAQRGLVTPLRRLLDRLPAPERRQTVQGLLERGSAARRAGATRLAVLSRDLGLLPALGRLLEDASLRPAAQYALRQLTFRPEAFSSHDQLLQWIHRNPTATYAELEARAARAWLEGGAGESQSELVRTREQVVDLTRRLLKMHFAQSPVRWVDVLELLRGSQVPGLLPQGLAELLANQGTLRKMVSGAEDPSLRELTDYLLEQSRSTRPAEERAVCLEAHVLLASAGDEKSRTAARLLALEQASRGDGPLRLAALRACQYFPGEDTVRGFLPVMENVLELATRSPDSQTYLREGLQTLEALEVPQDPALLERWLGLLDYVLISAREILSAELRSEALRVVGSAARDDALALLERYMDAVREVAGEERVRVEAFTWFETVACKILAQAEATLSGRVQDRVFRVIQAGLKDQSAALRGETAAALARIGETVKTLPAARLKTGAEAVAEALATETDGSAGGAAVKMIDTLRALGAGGERHGLCLAGLARRADLERPRPGSVVSDRLAEAVLKLGMAPAAPPEFRTQAVETLVILGRRKAALSLLSAYSPLDVKNGRRGRALTAAAAALALPLLRNETPSEAELRLAEGVLDAIDIARLKNELRPDARVDQHRVEVLVLLGRLESAVALAEEVFRVYGKNLPQGEVDALRLRQAALLLQLKKIDDALAILGNIRGTGSVTDQAQDLRAETLFQRSSFAEAENAFRAILQSGRFRPGSEAALLASFRLIESLVRQDKLEEANEHMRTIAAPESRELLERYRAVQSLLRDATHRNIKSGVVGSRGR